MIMLIQNTFQKEREKNFKFPQECQKDKNFRNLVQQSIWRSGLAILDMNT